MALTTRIFLVLTLDGKHAEQIPAPFAERAASIFSRTRKHGAAITEVLLSTDEGKTWEHWKRQRSHGTIHWRAHTVVTLEAHGMGAGSTSGASVAEAVRGAAPVMAAGPLSVQRHG